MTKPMQLAQRFAAGNPRNYPSRQVDVNHIVDSASIRTCTLVIRMFGIRKVIVDDCKSWGIK